MVCWLQAWEEGPGELKAIVPDTGSVRGVVTPPDFGARSDVSTAAERTRAAENGRGRDPWRGSLGDLQDRCRAGVVLVPAAGAAAGNLPIVAIGDDGSFRFDHVPPGSYAVHLVMRRRQGERVLDQRIDEAVARVEVVAGESIEVPLVVPAALVPPLPDPAAK